MTITLKKTAPARVGHYGSKGKRMVTPASYDIFLDGVKVGDMWGYCNTRLSDGDCGQIAKVFGVKLTYAGFRGTERKHMEEEITELAALHRPQK